MINSKFNENGLANTGTSLPICNKQQPITVNKAEVRDLQNDNGIMVPKPLEFHRFLKGGGTTTDAIMRPTPGYPQSQLCHQSTGGSDGNGHLVYVRRKSELELSKSNHCNYKDNTSDCPQQRQFSCQKQETPRQHTQIERPKNSSFSAFTPIPMVSLMTSSGGSSVLLEKPVNNLSAAEQNYSTVASGVRHPVNSQGTIDQYWKERTSDQYWKERSLRLQTHLRNCDHSSQEEYVHVLRSLSSAGRSEHAVELEKRAFHLAVEEGKEFRRVNAMHVLGKLTPTNLLLPSSQQVQSQN